MKLFSTFFFILSFIYGYSQTNIYGNLLSFNGALLSNTGEHIEIQDDPSLDFNSTQSFSIQFWINPKNLTTISKESNGIVTKKTTSGKGYGVFWEVTATTNKFKFKLDDGSAFTLSSPNIPSVNSIGWLHITAVLQRDANNTADSAWMYFDGEVVAKDEVTTIDDLSNTQDFYLMKSASSGVGELTGGGYLDEVRIWSTALTERQVRRTYNEPIYQGTALSLVRTTETNRSTTLTWSSLVMYHDMEDLTSGLQIVDKSFNTNNGIFFEGVNQCLVSSCGPAFMVPPVGEKLPNFTCNTTGDWSNSSTWVGGSVPANDNKTSIFVLDGAELTIDPSAIYKVKEVNVAEGGKLISDKLSTLQIANHFDVDGTYETENGGQILFDEVEEHIIDGSGTGILNFFNLALSQNSQLQINVPVNVYGVFFHENGRVRTNDQLTIRSNSSNTDQPYGLISRSSVGDPDVVGLIKVELELSSNAPGWRQMSFPLSGDFTDFMGLTLNLSSAPQNEQNVFYWDYSADATISSNNAGWTSPTALSNQTRAYSIYLDDNNFSFVNPITFEGEYNPGDKVYPLTYLNDPGNEVLSGQPQYENGVGWNFIPNPYPSLLDADQMTIDNPLLYKNIHVWDANTQQYKAFVQNPGTSENIIAYSNAGTDAAELSTGGVMPFQGFWVKTSNNSETLFTLQNNWRGVSFSNLNPQQSLKRRTGFQLNVFSNADSAWDGALISFDETAIFEFEIGKDVYKLISQGDVPSLSFDLGNVLASINRVNNTELHTKLNFHPSPTNEDGTYHLHLNQDHTSSRSSIYLEDMCTGIFTSLKDGDYTFSNSGQSSERFMLHYYPQGKRISDIPNPTVTCYGNDLGIVVKFNNMDDLRAKIIISNVMGQELFHSVNVNTQEDFSYNIYEESPMTCIVSVITSKLSFSKKIVR